MQLVAVILIGLCCAWITYQDVKRRLISVWSVLIFAAVSLGTFVYLQSPMLLVGNLIFTLCYFALMYFCLMGYFFIKTRKFVRIIDTKVGLGDILVILTIGPTLEPIHQLYFFTAVFSASLVLHLLFSAKATIPLAGYLCSGYLICLAVVSPEYFL